MTHFKCHLTTHPSDVEDGDAFAIKIVAVTGHANDWAAYWGPTSATDLEVAKLGAKLTKEQAAPLFYVMRRSGRHYRH
jgi:hypothetical protein